MIRLTINQNSYDLNPTHPLDWPLILDEIGNKYLTAEQMIVGLKLNQKEYAWPSDHLSLEVLENLEHIELEVISKEDLAYQMLVAFDDHLLQCVSMIGATTKSYREGQSGKAEHFFIRVVELLEVFAHSLEYIHRVYEKSFEEKLFLKEQVEKGEQVVLALLKELLVAKEKKNMIFLADLLEYELITVLRYWKDDLIPQLLDFVRNEIEKKGY